MEDNASREASLHRSLGNSQTIAGDAGSCSLVRIIEGYEYCKYCKEKKATNQVIGGAFMVDGGFLALALALEAMGQSIL